MTEYDFIPGPDPQPVRPSPLGRGTIGATEYAYPNGMLHERIWRWCVRQARRLLRRPARPAP